MTVVATLAEDLGTSQPTVRRAINVGMIRAQRVSPRKVHISVGEMTYLRDHWQLLAALREALRTEPSVERAVLYGSVARGSDDGSSDIDLAVKFRSDLPYRAIDLQLRLSERMQRSVQVIDAAIVPSGHSLRLEIDRDGRTVVDRRGVAA